MFDLGHGETTNCEAMVDFAYNVRLQWQAAEAVEVEVMDARKEESQSRLSPDASKYVWIER